MPSSVWLEVFDVTGTFMFEVTGTRSLRDETESLNLRVKSAEADVQLGTENPRCGGLAEIAGTFLSLVPTFPAQYYPQGFNIQVANGIGSSSLAVEPYLLVVEVAQLGE